LEVGGEVTGSIGLDVGFFDGLYVGVLDGRFDVDPDGYSEGLVVG